MEATVASIVAAKPCGPLPLGLEANDVGHAWATSPFLRIAAFPHHTSFPPHFKSEGNDDIIFENTFTSFSKSVAGFQKACFSKTRFVRAPPRTSEGLELL